MLEHQAKGMDERVAFFHIAAGELALPMPREHCPAPGVMSKAAAA
jgi:hypothetical protein